MKLFSKAKDGGSESSVTGYWLVELKRLFSVVLLRFDGRSREAFHTHAFHSLSWVLSGELREEFIDGRVRIHRPHWRPLTTHHSDFHKVDSRGTTWVLSFRGPWQSSWLEYLPTTREFLTLGGRRAVLARTRLI